MSMLSLTNKPVIMYVRTTDRCNSGCFMCRFSKGQGTFNIEMQQFENLLNKMLMEKSYKMIRFTGGEPLLEPQLPQMIKKANGAGFLTSVITNGFLMPQKYKTLIDCGLNQVIFSLDGSTPEIHDKLRNFPRCHNNIIRSIQDIKQYNPNVKIRINTVVSKYNIEDLCNLYDLLVKMGVDSWSIIPIRTSQDGWNDGSEEKYIGLYKNFVQYIKDCKSVMKLLGYSLNWAGRNEKEVHEFFYNNKFYGPHKKCKAVNFIRFYAPETDQIVPCNCASHRIGQIKVALDKTQSIDKRTALMKKWLQKNGPKKCKACEPLNAYLSDNFKKVDDIFVL